MDTADHRFWRQVDRSGGAEACWPWTAGKSDGYGRFKLPSKRVVGAHRLAYTMTKGISYDEPEVVMHSCDNPPCCNPAHLSAGTQSDNVRDMDSKNRRGVLGPRRPKWERRGSR